jgi:hypothetical protein
MPESTPSLLPLLVRELRRSPFVPLQIHLRDGRSFPVEHPGYCLVDDGHRTISLCHARNRVHFIDLGSVVSIEREMRA